MRVSDIIPESSTDGPGLRWVVFVQGCEHHCPGCHNPQTWDKNGGFEISPAELVARFRSEATSITRGITITGGEPFLQADALVPLAKYARVCGYDLWIYTGFCYEEIRRTTLARLADVIVDGPYIETERTLDVPFIGSRNQRLVYQ